MNAKLENEERVENLREIFIEDLTPTRPVMRAVFRLGCQNGPLFEVPVGINQRVMVTLRFEDGVYVSPGFCGGPVTVKGIITPSGRIAVAMRDIPREILEEVEAITSQILLRDLKGSR